MITLEGAVLDKDAPHPFKKSILSPEGAAASIGLALCLCSLEAWRFPVITEITHHSSAASQLCALLGLLAAGLYYRFGKSSILNHPFAIVTVALFTAISLYINFTTMSDDGSLELLSLVKCSSFAFGFILFCIWAENLLDTSRLFGISIFVGAFLCTFVMQTVIGILLPTIAKGVCVALPLLSGVLLILFRRYHAINSWVHASDKTIPSDKACGMDSRQKIYYGLLLVAFSCYGFLFKTMHFQWLPLQAASWSPLAIQMISALGALLAGVALLLLLKSLSGSNGVLMCEILILILTLLALWFSTIFSSDGLMALSYLVPLNGAQKTLYLLTFIVCLAISPLRKRTLMFTALLFFYRVGSSSDLFEAMIPVPSGWGAMNSLFVAGASLIIIFQLFWSLLNVFSPEQHRPANPSNAPTPTIDDSSYRNAAFLFFLCQKYHFTLREIDVLCLLEQHEGSSEIARELMISPATAKTHMRNIYAKSGVHSQNELARFLKAERDSFRLDS